MLRSAFVLLFGLATVAYGQLMLGVCKPPQNYERNLDFGKYSGTWYVIAQSRFHPMEAVNCQRVTYSATRNGMSVTYNTSKNYEHQQKYKNGTLTQTGDNKGEMKLSLNAFPRQFNFHVLSVNYSQVAVEYTCLPGAISKRATITVLHRQPLALREPLALFLQKLYLTHAIPASLRNPIRLVNHSHCEY